MCVGGSAAPAAAASSTIINLDIASMRRGRSSWAPRVECGTRRRAPRGRHRREPAISGGFDMRNGTINMAGSTLPSPACRVSFNGSRLKKRNRSTLDFTATNVSNGVTYNAQRGRLCRRAGDYTEAAH